jgi:hypothetical protein
MADETPVLLESDARVVMHLIPFASMGNDAPSLDLATVEKSAPPPMAHAGGWNYRYNIDGFVTFSGAASGAQFSYLQIFRTGALETTTTEVIRAQAGALMFYPLGTEEQVLKGLKQYIPFYKAIGIEPPIVVAVTLLRFKGATLPPDSSRRLPSRSGYPIDRDTLLLPDVLLRNYDEALPTLMRPVFDALWQSLGIARSPSYDKAGNWSERSYR